VIDFGGDIVAGCHAILFSAAGLAYRPSFARPAAFSVYVTGLFAFAGSTFPGSRVIRMTDGTE